MKTIDEVIETLNKDSKCSKPMLDWVIYRIYDIENFSSGWNLSKIKNGYRLSYETYSFDYFYSSFV